MGEGDGLEYSKWFQLSMYVTKWLSISAWLYFHMFSYISTKFLRWPQHWYYSRQTNYCVFFFHTPQTNSSFVFVRCGSNNSVILVFLIHFEIASIKRASLLMFSSLQIWIREVARFLFSDAVFFNGMSATVSTWSGLASESS